MNEDTLQFERPTKEECDEYEREWRAACITRSAELEAIHHNLVWVDPEPEWVSATSWIDELDKLVTPPTEGDTFKTAIRLMLPGGSPRDEVRITVEFRRGEPHIVPWFPNDPTLRVTVFADDGAQRWHAGRISNEANEIDRSYITGLPVPVAERVAALIRTIALTATWDAAGLLRAIQPHRADRLSCICCARPLRDEVSKAIGIGPDCAAGLGIPHNLSTAHKAAKARDAKGATNEAAK